MNNLKSSEAYQCFHSNKVGCVLFKGLEQNHVYLKTDTDPGQSITTVKISNKRKDTCSITLTLLETNSVKRITKSCTKIHASYHEARNKVVINEVD